MLLIRPTAPTLCSPGDGEQHLTGTVADVAFRGRGYEHAVDTPGRGRLTGIFAPTRFDRGDAVGMRLDPTGCYLFPSGETAFGSDAAGTASEPSPANSAAIQGAGLLGLDRV
jgi:hypothetical protein